MKIYSNKGIYEKCTVHPRYKAVLKPRSKCHVCWAMWLAKNVFFQSRCLVGDIEGIEFMLEAFEVPFERAEV